MNKRTLAIFGLFLIGASTSFLHAQTGDEPVRFPIIPAEVEKRIIVRQSGESAGFGVRYQRGKELFTSAVQTFIWDQPRPLAGIGVKLFANGNNLDGARLNYELRIYEIGAIMSATRELIQPPLRVTPFWIEGNFKEATDYLYLVMPEPVPLESGKAYAFEVSLMSKNSSRLTFAINRNNPNLPAEQSAYMVNSATNEPLGSVPIPPSGFSLDFFLTTTP